MNFNICRILFILVFAFCAAEAFGQKNKPDPCEIPTREGSGFSGSSRSESTWNGGLAIDPAPTPTNNSEIKPKVYPVGTKPLQIISKPRAFYTDLARAKCVQGKVVLKVAFLSNGQIGKIKVVKGLPYGLSEQAVTVARKMRFDPAMKRGKPVSVTKMVEYNFTIY